MTRRLHGLLLILIAALFYGCVAGGDGSLGSTDQVLSGPWLDTGACTNVTKSVVRDNHENCTWTCYKRCRSLSVNWSVDGVAGYPNQLWNTDGTPQDCKNDPACVKARQACAAAAPGQCAGFGGPRTPSYDWSCVPTGSSGTSLCTGPTGPEPQSQTGRQKSYGLRFDVVTFNGICSGAGDLVKGRTKCFACDDLAIMNQGPPHFLTLPGDVHGPQVWKKGNALAAYVNDLTGLWKGTSGKLVAHDKAPTTAAQLMASLSRLYTCGVPSFIILNEISRSAWRKNYKKCPAGRPCTTYRHYVVDLARRLRRYFGKHVIVASPFWYPIDQVKHPALKADWKALGKQASIAIEANELNGHSVWVHKDRYGDEGDPVSYSRARYKMMLRAYASFGIPYGKLMILQNFANTCNPTAKPKQPGACCSAGHEHCKKPGPFGRYGVPLAQWKKVVRARDAALKQLLVDGANGHRFAGVLSYGWGGYWGVPHDRYISERHDIMRLYENDWKTWN